MAEAKVDQRPEGSILLEAAMYGSWNAVLYVAQYAAAASGKRVLVEDVERPDLKGILFHSITFGR